MNRGSIITANCRVHHSPCTELNPPLKFGALRCRNSLAHAKSLCTLFGLSLVFAQLEKKTIVFGVFRQPTCFVGPLMTLERKVANRMFLLWLFYDLFNSIQHITMPFEIAVKQKGHETLFLPSISNKWPCVHVSDASDHQRQVDYFIFRCEHFYGPSLAKLLSYTAVHGSSTGNFRVE